MKTSVPPYFVVDRLAIEVHPDRQAIGRAAARAATACLREAIALRGEARVIFGCAPSQDDFFANLTDPAAGGGAVDWSKVTAFHMDDYVGLAGDHPQSFRHYLQKHLLARVPVGRFHPLPADERDLGTVCARYAARLTEKPIDVIFLGIGENGHIAFNDPAVADFDDPVVVKKVELDAACRQQQVHDGCFAAISEVPRQALTLTIPVFRQAGRLSVQVPGVRKAPAVRSALRGAITPACPASVLRLHPQATLYLDSDSARLL